ncbi:hypothetical protein HUG15_14565 [Salicibibacter cibarius]|uniref:Uncharacterized protein n=1 Tax=Salicibibacter cibarius TaxID=2743000 RepID=A0A7T7CC60_9BACI|nr:hypothetical protein [Salicibibacter cibarius]QQK76667.1 hypothetical protein HUG15_14565 [Salicibibacter cibarius]
MVITSAIVSIGIIIACFAVGLISFYPLSDWPKAEKKRHIEALTSQLLNFVIFVWVGKILLNPSLFIQDPMAVLAYPGNSGAFYLATLFTAIIVVYKSVYKNLDVLAFVEVFVHVFLVASFFYEFMQLVLGNHSYSLGYLIVLATLLVVFVSARGRLPMPRLLMTILVGWTAGMLVLTFVQPFATVFGYIIEPWFIGLFFIGCLLIVFVSKRKRDA